MGDVGSNKCLSTVAQFQTDITNGNANYIINIIFFKRKAAAEPLAQNLKHNAGARNLHTRSQRNSLSTSNIQHLIGCGAVDLQVKSSTDGNIRYVYAYSCTQLSKDTAINSCNDLEVSLPIAYGNEVTLVCTDL